MRARAAVAALKGADRPLFTAFRLDRGRSESWSNRQAPRSRFILVKQAQSAAGPVGKAG